MSNTILRTKVFVGNVPFQCTREEFQECFKHMEGFETADIIRRYKSKLSRGFGFVVFKEEAQSKKLLDDVNEIKLKDRVLRFSSYENEEKPTKIKNSHQIYVSNLDIDTTHEQLKNAIQNTGTSVSACFVNVKNNKNIGIICVNSLEDYTKLLENPPFLNDKPLILKPYRRNNKTDNTHHTNARVAYREGFRAGHLVGFQQGFQQGQDHKKNIEKN